MKNNKNKYGFLPVRLAIGGLFLIIGIAVTYNHCRAHWMKFFTFRSTFTQYHVQNKGLMPGTLNGKQIKLIIKNNKNKL